MLDYKKLRNMTETSFLSTKINRYIYTNTVYTIHSISVNQLDRKYYSLCQLSLSMKYIILEKKLNTTQQQTIGTVSKSDLNVRDFRLITFRLKLLIRSVNLSIMRNEECHVYFNRKTMNYYHVDSIGAMERA